MYNDLHPQLRPALAIAEGMIYIVERLVRSAAHHVTPKPPPRNATLRPGPATPMWNALVMAVRPHLRRRGAKINLGRELRLPPQRINEFFVARTAAPDAERTLELLRWLAARRPLDAASVAPRPRSRGHPLRRS